MSSKRAVHSAEIRIAGKTQLVPSAEIAGRTVVVTGKWLRMAKVKDEELVHGEIVEHPGDFIRELKNAGLNADIFSFSQKFPHVEPKHEYHREWENLAVVPITTHEDWLKNRVEYDVRKAIKKAAKCGVVARTAKFDDDFVKGIVGIYNDCPIRQGKAFWHYQKAFDRVKEENATYLDRSEFIGAYYGEELIGFIKMVYVDQFAMTLQVISKVSHYDKKSTNALLAKAIEVCEQKGCSHLIYGNFIYTDASSSLTEFKRRNGFGKVDYPRYFIPLTTKGRIALRLGAHHGVKGMLPEGVTRALLKARRRLYEALGSFRSKKAAK